MHRDRLRPLPTAVALLVTLLALAPRTARSADVVELRSGAKVSGEILSRTDKEVSIRYKVGAYTYTRTYPMNLVRAITANGRREVVGGGEAPAPASSGTTAAAPSPAGPGRTREEVLALIDKVGRTPPDWFDATPLKYPPTLDLSWPGKPPGPWNNQKNVGQFVWDVINPNPGKWREGVRLMHHLLALHQDHPETRTRAMLALGRMYFNLIEDYARAAFWWRKAGVDRGEAEEPVVGTFLAECYRKLGSRQMAVELLGRIPPRFETVKVWADLGEIDKALQLAEAMARDWGADLAYLYAGDACRVAGRYPQAMQYYQKVLDVAPGEATGRGEKNKERARANLEAIRLFALSDVGRVPDGTYRASSLGYEAPIEVEVAVRDRRLQSVRVTQHREKQFYSALTDTPNKIIAKQGVRGVDATSGATITSEAILNATAKALAAAAK